MEAVLLLQKLIEKINKGSRFENNQKKKSDECYTYNVNSPSKNDTLLLLLVL